MDQLSKMQLTEQQLKHWFVSLAEVEMSWEAVLVRLGMVFPH